MSLTTSPTTSSNKALALQAQLARDAIEAERAGDVVAAQIARDSSKFVAWMDSIPPERLEVELFGYSAHEIDWQRYNRQLGESLLRKHDPSSSTQPKRRQRKPSIRSMIAAAERAGKKVTSITTPDGVTLHFGKGESTEASNPWLDDLKVTKQ